MHDTQSPTESASTAETMLIFVQSMLTAVLISMTVTDPEHIYEHDFVLAHTEAGRKAGEVLHVHEETNTLAVRLYENGYPTNEVMVTPAHLVDLHPGGRPLGDDEWDDGFTEYSYETDNDDESEDNA